MERTMAIVQTEISLHQLINGLEELASVYPSERISVDDINRITAVAQLLLSRVSYASLPSLRRIGPEDRRSIQTLGQPILRRDNEPGRRSTDTVGYWTLPMEARIKK
jgi:hypothetical protein